MKKQKASNVFEFNPEYPFKSARQLHEAGDIEAVKRFYRENPDIFLLEAFFFLKRDQPFNASPNWYLAVGTKFWEKYSAWVEKIGLEARGMDHYKIPQVVSGIESFIRDSKQERAAVAIANSGLYGGFLAKGMGINTYIVDCHRKGNGTSYKEIEDFNIAGKDVLIIDNDVSTGKTIKRVAREISKKNPEKMSFLFYYTPHYSEILDCLKKAGYSNARVYDTNALPLSPNTLDLIEKIEQE